MKYLFTFLLVSQSIFSQIRNGDFESELSQETWRPNGNGFNVELAEDPINGGMNVLKVQNTGGDFFSLSQTAQRSETPHIEKVKFSGWIKTKEVTQGMARLWFRALDKNGRRLTYVDYTPTVVTGTSEWRKVEMTISVPAPATKLEYGVVAIGPGTSWFDSLAFEKVSSAPLARSAKATKYLDNAFKIIVSKSIRKDSIDTASLRKLMYAVAEEAQTTKDCHESISCVLANLGDHHSFLKEKEEVKAYSSESAQIEMPSGKMIGSIAYLKIPAFMSDHQKTADKYAETMQRLITDFDAKGAKQWVVDARHNTGGNCAPMLLGVSPLLGNGFASCGVNNSGKKDFVMYKNGGLYDNGKRYAKIRNPYTLKNQNPKVAVLIDRMCASSGEVVVMAFKNAPNSKSFGEATYGNTTGNTDFTLSDGAAIYLATHLGADRAGNIYDYKIMPEVAVLDDETTEGDEVMEAAMAWLLSN